MRSRSPSRGRSPPGDGGYTPPPMMDDRYDSPGNRSGDDHYNGNGGPARGGRSRERSFSPGRSRSRSYSYSRSPVRDRGFSRGRGRFSRSPSISLSGSRSRSYSRSRSRSLSRSFSRSPRFSRGRSRSLSPRRYISRSPSPRRSIRRSRSRGRGRSRGPDSRLAGGEDLHKRMLVIVDPTAEAGAPHIREIFGEYGELAKVRVKPSFKRIRARKAYIVYVKEECAQKALDYMDGAMIGGKQISVNFANDEDIEELKTDMNRSRGGKNPNKRRNNRGGRSGKRRRLSPSPSRTYRGNDRSPSPYRRRRFTSRGRRSPIRSNSPYARDHYSGSRRYNRSPSPRYGGYRGRRFHRSRSISRHRR
ncbi:hypothetical protein H4R24_000715 [Coemansia sp. RSA 988]|nr:hypothetical protein H4R24_000715 [Coemansia sp. RSA 988]